MKGWWQDFFARRFVRRHDDRDFLPAALEIIESPPSPIAMNILITLVGTLAFFVLWSMIGQLDIIATAQGKVQPRGSVKMIQSIEAGKVSALMVQNGSLVKKDEILIQLDDSDAKAEHDGIMVTLAASRAEVYRRGQAIAAASSQNFNLGVLEWPFGIPEYITQREESVLRIDVAQLRASIDGFRAQLDSKNAEISKIQSILQEQQRQINIGRERVELRETLTSRELGSKLQLLDARDALQQHVVSFVQLEGQLHEARLALANIEAEIAKSGSGFLADDAQKRSLAQRLEDELAQKLVRAAVRVNNLVLRAPIDGLVHSLSVTTIGQVIASGTEIMRIVPGDSNDIEIECYLPNRDAGFVHKGQEASLKVDAYPFTRYGTIKARVIRIGGDSMPEPDAQVIEGNMAAPKRQPFFFTGDRTQNLVFPVTLYIDNSSTRTNGYPLKLSVGMTVTAEIVTGRRSVMSYLLSSVWEVSSRALIER